MLIPFLLATTVAAPAPHAAPALAVLVAPAQDWKETLDRGKAALWKGDVEGAVAAFTSAHEASGGAIATELWVLRGRVAKGDIDRSFDRIVEIDASGEAKGPDLAYVIGSARFAAAERAAAAGKNEAGGMYQEAAGYLKDATNAAPDAFGDAWMMLANAARMGGDPETAVTAIEKVLERDKSAAALTLAAKIRTAYGAALTQEDATKAAGEALLRQAVKDAEAAAKALGDDKAAADAHADVEMQRGVALLYLGDRERGGEAYATAIGWAPTKVDYGQLMVSLRGEDGDVLFIDTVGEGVDAYTRRYGEKAKDEALARWYRGYAQVYGGQYDGAIESFRQAFEEAPGYTSSLWYIGFAEWNKGVERFPAAADAWEQHARKNPAEFAQTVNTGDNAGYVGRAVQMLWKDGQPHLDNLQAARFAELLVVANPSDPYYWSSVGVMNRDAGLAVARRKPKDAPKSAEEYYERAWNAYSRAMALERRPEFLNDGAVILHYYLERDYDEAIALYDEAEAIATKWLAGEHDFSGEASDAKQVVETALRDAKDNRAKLRKKMGGK